MASPTAFKVIIVGGSLGGLTLAHCLSRAKIDYIVLEARSELAPDLGATIGLSPNGARILDQLGMWEAVQGKTGRMGEVSIRGPDGVAFIESDMFEFIKYRLGYHCIYPARQEVLEILAERIEEKERIYLNQKVVEIKHFDGGVTVVTKDGVEYTGNLVVGADGVHSKVRSEMWRYADGVKPGLITEKEKTGMTAEYSCVFGISTPTPGVTGGHAELTINNGHSFLCFPEEGEKGRVFWFLVETLDKKRTWPDIPRFTKEDAEKFASKHINGKFIEKTTFGDLWKNRTTFNMTTLEEGLFDHWHFGRIVCLGDAAHKMTPNLGQGANCAMESAAALANNLHKLLNINQNHSPTPEELDPYLRTYAESRKGRIAVIHGASAMATRFQARYGFVAKMMREYIFSRMEDRSLDKNCEMMVGAVKIDYLPVPEKSVNCWMPFDENLGYSKKPKVSRRMLEASPFLVLLGIALWARSGWGGGESPRQNYVAGLLETEKNALLGPLPTDISGVLPWAESLLKQLVIRYSPALDRLSPAERLKMLYNVGELIPIYTVWTVEAWRWGNFSTFANLAMLFGLAGQSYGFGVVAPLYFFFHYAQTSYHNYTSIDLRIVPKNYALTIIPTLFTTMILPLVLLFGPFNFSPYTYQIISLMWQTFPLWSTILHHVLTIPVPDTKNKDRFTPGVDIPILKAAYMFAGLFPILIRFYVSCAAAVSPTQLPPLRSLDLSSFLGSFFGGIDEPTAIINFVGHASTMLWIVMTFFDLKRIGVTDVTWVRMLTALSFGTLVGPGVVLVGFWMWREDVIARQRTSKIRA